MFATLVPKVDFVSLGRAIAQARTAFEAAPPAERREFARRLARLEEIRGDHATSEADRRLCRARSASWFRRCSRRPVR